MEILTYLLEGALEHKDSSGAGSVIHPGELQRMSAGTGIAHSEYNHSGSDIVHFLQIWLLPERKGLKPGYQQQKFRREEMHGKLLLIADRDGRNGGVTVHQDVYLYAALLEPGQKITHPLEPGRHAWLQVARGAVALNGSSLNAGDGAAVSQEVILEIDAKKMSEILLFDLA
jgi:redox-sensitive bicupin YhaK (pirin superfamily)